MKTFLETDTFVVFSFLIDVFRFMREKFQKKAGKESSEKKKAKLEATVADLQAKREVVVNSRPAIWASTFFSSFWHLHHIIYIWIESEMRRKSNL